MRTNKRILIVSVAIVAVIALTLGISFAAWDNSSAKDDYVVAVGSNADLTVQLTKNTDGKVLVPSGQIGLGLSNTDKIAVKTLGNIKITLNNDAEGDDLAVVYAISAIYAVPNSVTDTFADIKKMDDTALAAKKIVDLNKNYIDNTDGATINNPRYITGDTKIVDKTAPVGTDLRINLIDSSASKNYKAGDEISFDTATATPTINQLTLSMEFTRTALEDFKTMNEFLNSKIMFEITFTLKAKTPTPVAP